MGWQDDQVVQPAAGGWEADEVVTPAQPAAPSQIAQAATSGLGGINRGIAAVAGLPVDTVANVMDLGRAGIGTVAGLFGRPDLMPDIPNRGDIPLSGEWIANRLTNLGVQTQPTSNALPNRIAFAAGTGLPAGLLTPQQAIPNALRGGLGGMAGMAAMDATGDPAAAAAASLAAGASPNAAMAGMRGVVRGGEAGRVRMERNIADFTRAGANPSLGQATESGTWRAVESVLSRVPGGAGVMRARGLEQQQGLGAGTTRLAEKMSPGANAERAGRSIERGVEDHFLPESRATQNRLYADLDQHIQPQAAVPVTSTLTALDRIAGGIAGAPTTSGTRVVQNPLAIELRDAIRADAPYGGLPYEALAAIRTRIGERLNAFELAPDIPRQQLRQIYAGLSEDMREAARLNGPAAERAFNRANNFTRGLHDRIDNLQRVIDKNGGPEKVFQGVISGTGEGATTFRTVMRSIPPEAQSAVAAAVVRRLGRATPGNQNDVGDAFSTQTFLTNWARLSPQAKATLTGPFAGNFRGDLDALARVANNLREGSKVYANPSGTSAGLASIGAAGGVGSALATGNYAAAGLIAGGATAAHMLARIVNNQTFIRSMARATGLPPDVLISQLTNLSAYRQDEPEQQAQQR